MGGIKQITCFILLSAGVLLVAHYLALSTQWLMTGYGDLIQQLQTVFASNQLGGFLSALLALLAIPLILSGIAALIYWAFKRQAIPNYFVYLWGVWLILVTLLIARS